MVKLVTDELILIEALREKVNADEYHPNLELKFDVTLNNGKVREVDPQIDVMYKKEGKTYLVEAFATLARDSNQWTKTSDKKVRTDALKLLAIKKLAIDGNIEELKGVNQESLKLNILMEINTKDAFLNSKRNTVVFLESLGIEVEWVVASQLVFEKLMKNPGKYKIDEDSRYFRRKQKELFEVIENMPEQTMTGDEWNELLESLKESVKTPENMKEEGKKLE